MLFSIIGAAQNGVDLSQKVPFDPSFRIGTLPNGLTYYIKQNTTPKGKASFYLYQNVGSVLENDKQHGLAHFLEHMAFNGTSHFPGNSMIDWLENKGVKFGSEINAYTSTNETVYNLSRVPITNEKVLDSCLLILSDWCNNLTLDASEIDAERKVIQEEWRQLYTANYRFDKQLKDVRYNYSIYSKRDPLGSMDIVKNFKYSSLRNFYNDWCRTDLQAISVIGDFNVDEVEAKIKNRFAQIPAIKTPKLRTYVTIPENKDPLFKIAKDKEVRETKLNLEIRQFYKKDNSQAQLRALFVHTFFMKLMANRYTEALRNPNLPYSYARAVYTDFEKNYKAFNLSLVAKDGQVEAALKAVYTEIQRVVQYGFTEQEIEQLKTKLINKNEASHKNSRVSKSDAYGARIKAAYLDGVAVSSKDFDYNFTKTVIPTITRQEVSEVINQYLTKKNRVFTITAPDKTDLELPNLQDIQKIMYEVEHTTLEPYVDFKKLDLALLENEPEGGAIVSENIMRDFKAIEWKLSNGAKVVYKYSTYKKNHIELKAISAGGSSLYAVDDIPSFNTVSLANKYGIGDLDPQSYSNIMTDNSATSKVKLSAYQEYVLASAANKDIESMFQLVYMRFEAPRFDEDIFNTIMANNYKGIENPSKNPNVLIGNKYRKVVANGDPRYFEFNKAYLDQMDFNRAKEIYKERFNNASDFTFYMIGDAPLDTVRTMVKKYIGAIQGEGEKEDYQLLENYFPKGKHTYRFSVPNEAPMATVVIKMEDEPITYNRARMVYHSLLDDILNIRFLENIREKEGGVYAIGVNTNTSRMPIPKLSMDISFSCDPNNAEHLRTLVYQELEHIQKEVKQSDLDKVVLNVKKARPGNLQTNDFWMTALETYYTYGENMMAPMYFDDILDQVTTEDIQNAANYFLSNAKVLDFIFLPESASE
ncbi:M16 family metallopeptidase [Formosa haliotis]|uniref:M16 family metallopeptidase n=1 Tax=Formosa haliotis TaxID=1555194 RepID=UPI0008254199|nr:M16 family metallopeptidase [Formosa haliotis]